MSTSALLARRMLRGGGARDLRTHGLAVLATAVAVTVMLLTLGAVTGLADRDGRTAWLRPAATDDAVAVQTTSTTYVDGKPLTLVHLAALPGERGGDRALPAPPGMDAFPKPGEVAVSPALRDLLASRPADQRPVGPVTAELGTDGLIGPDQLVAVVGARPVTRRCRARPGARPTPPATSPARPRSTTSPAARPRPRATNAATSSSRWWPRSCWSSRCSR